MVAQIVDEHLAPCDEAPQGSEALTESSHKKLHLIGQTEVRARATTVVPEDTEAVSFVDHH